MSKTVRPSGISGASDGRSEEKKTEKLKGFNIVWSKLPHISWYQLRLSILGGYCCFISGLWATYPNFAQYKPPTRCQTAFDIDSQAYFTMLTYEILRELLENILSLIILAGQKSII